MRNKKSKTKKLFLTLAMFLLSTTINAAWVSLNLDVRIDDPTTDMGGPKRTDPIIPEVNIDGYMLQFVTPCDGCTLRIVSNGGEVVYSTVITTNTISLPTTFEGLYEIQIVRDGWCFFGYVLF